MGLYTFYIGVGVPGVDPHSGPCASGRPRHVKVTRVTGLTGEVTNNTCRGQYVVGPENSQQTRDTHVLY